MRLSRNDIPVGKRVYATYKDEYNNVKVSFVPTYILDNGKDNLVIGVKNNQVRVSDGSYHMAGMLTGNMAEQIDTKNLFHIYTKDR